MAGAVAGFFANAFPDDPPTMITVEPQRAACIFESAKQGKLAEVDGDLDTMIAGLACGVPSTIGWPILRDLSTAHVWINDGLAGNGMRLLHKVGIVAGECGGVGPGLLQYLCTSTDDVAKRLKAAIGLGSDSHVVSSTQRLPLTLQTTKC